MAETCQQIRGLSPQPEQIIIALDGCSDGSAEMLRRDFPEVTVMEFPVSVGSVACRDATFRRVTSEFIVSLDDDSFPMQSDFLTRLNNVFLDHPEAGVVMFAELRKGTVPADPRLGPETPGRYVNTYVGCAAAIRRSVYEGVGTYEPLLWHTYEEPDFVQQCYGGGWATWFEPSIHVWHNFTPSQRIPLRNHHLNARNEVLSVLMRCPLGLLPFMLVYRAALQARFALGEGLDWLVREPQWWWDTLRLSKQALQKRRRPLSYRKYWTWLWLTRNPCSGIADLRSRLGDVKAQG